MLAVKPRDGGSSEPGSGRSAVRLMRLESVCSGLNYAMCVSEPGVSKPSSCCI